MPPAALTLTGLQTPTLEELHDQFVQIFQGLWSASINVGERSVEGQTIGIVTEALELVYELIEAVYASQDPTKASGAALEALCLLTGTTRRPASYSQVRASLVGVDTTLVPIGTIFATDSTNAQFQTIESATITALDAWASSSVYLVDDLVTNSGNAYQCIFAGVSAPSGGPTTTSADITDGIAHWSYLGVGTAAALAYARATVTGPVTAVARDLTEIVTATGGLNSVINVLDATEGDNEMTDAELRALREAELAQPGTSTQAAIAAALLELDNVTAVTVFLNNSDATDGDGMPPHSVEALVQGGDDQEIWDTLLANVAAGIQTHGTEVGTATDTQGTVHTEKFSRSDDIEIYIAITVTYVASKYPNNGDAQIKEAIVNWGNENDNGVDAVASAISARAFDVTGVHKVTTCFIGTAPSPVASTDIAITTRQRAVYDTSRITVTSSAVTP